MNWVSDSVRLILLHDGCSLDWWTDGKADASRQQNERGTKEKLWLPPASWPHSPICTHSCGLAGSFEAHTCMAEGRDFMFWLTMQRSESELDKKGISQVQSWVGDGVFSLLNQQHNWNVWQWRMRVGNNASLIHVQSGTFQSCFYSLQTLITRKGLSRSGVTKVSESVKSIAAYSCLLSEESQRSSWNFSPFSIDDKRPTNCVNLQRPSNRVIIESEFWDQLRGKNGYIYISK